MPEQFVEIRIIEGKTIPRLELLGENLDKELREVVRRAGQAAEIAMKEALPSAGAGASGSNSGNLKKAVEMTKGVTSGRDLSSGRFVTGPGKFEISVGVRQGFGTGDEDPRKYAFAVNDGSAAVANKFMIMKKKDPTSFNTRFRKFKDGSEGIGTTKRKAIKGKHFFEAGVEAALVILETEVPGFMRNDAITRIKP